MNTHYNSPNKRHGQDTKNADAIRLYYILYDKPKSRRMAATELGYTDLTYMVTQTISDWIKSGKACVIGQLKCERSQRLVEGVTTNPDLFPKSNQLKLF